MASDTKDKLKKHYEATGRMFEADDLEPQPKKYIKEINPEQKLAKEGKKAAAKEVGSMRDLGGSKKGMFAKGGKIMKEGKMMKKEGRGMAKAEMQKHSDIKKDKPMMEKVAKKAVKGHEVRMHGAKKMMGGGMAYGSGGKIDGCATKGTTKGTMIKMAKGGKTC
jgi:hypothetical protein